MVKNKKNSVITLLTIVVKSLYKHLGHLFEKFYEGMHWGVKDKTYLKMNH